MQALPSIPLEQAPRFESRGRRPPIRPREWTAASLHKSGERPHMARWIDRELILLPDGSSSLWMGRLQKWPNSKLDLALFLFRLSFISPCPGVLYVAIPDGASAPVGGLPFVALNRVRVTGCKAATILSAPSHSNSLLPPLLELYPTPPASMPSSTSFSPAL